MYLIIYSQKNSATLRTLETVTEAIKKQCEAGGFKLAGRRNVPDSLVDNTYATARMAREAAEQAGFAALTRQKVSSLHALKLGRF